MSKFTGNIIRLPAVTPTQNSASGVYTLDDQFTAQSSGTWPIVRDQYFNYTTLLLTGAVQGTAYPNPVTQPYSFLSDASTNNFVVSPNGDVSARPFNPYLNSYSVYFPGSSKLVFSSSSAWTFGTGNWTIEFWIRVPALPASTVTFIDMRQGGAITNHCTFYLTSTGQVGIYVDSSPSTFAQTSGSNLVVPNQWTYVAYVRDGNTINIYFNGIFAASTTTTVSIPATTPSVGGEYAGANYLVGNLSNLRVSKSARYTSNFTPSTVPLTDSGASVLALQSNRFIDVTGNTTLSVNTGTPAVSQNSPFVSYDTTNGSGYFDGTGDYLSVADNTALDMEASDFTMECWVYLSETPSSADGIFAKRTDIGTFGGVLIFFNGLTPNFYATLNGSSWGIAFSSSISATLNAWTHLAFTRSGNTWTIYVNGVSGGTGNSSGTVPNNTSAFVVGAYSSDGNATYLFPAGYISNVRVVKGTAITPPAGGPTAPLQAVTNTSLLTLQTRAPATNNGFIDSSPNNFVVTRNGNTTQGSFSPFSPTGWGNYFNGSSNYRLTIPDSTDLDIAGDFCLEMWAYFTSTSASNQLVCIGSENAAQNGFIFYQTNTSEVVLYTNGSAAITTSSAGITANRWYHLALVRNGSGAGNTVIYVDGVSRGSAQITTSFTGLAANGLSIGQTYHVSYVGVLNAYLSNVRLVNGSPVYTGAFTPPAAPLTVIANTKLLTCQSNRFLDQTGKTITVTGSPSVQAFSPFAPAQSYIPSQIGGSGYFDGISDYLSGPTNTASSFNLTGDFTVECWAYFTSASTAGQGLVTWADSGGWNGWQFINDAGTIKFEFLAASSAAATVTGGTVVNNQWYHLAVVRNGSGSNNVVIYINGASSGSPTTYTGTQGTSASSFFRVGVDRTATNEIVGYISGARVVNGTALYTSNFTVPTAPPTAIPNTSLLLNFTNGGIVDATGKNNLETVANSGVQTSIINPFGSRTGLMYFNGSSYFYEPYTQLMNQLNGNFTMECWIYPTTSGVQQIFAGSLNSAGSTNWLFQITSANKLSFSWVNTTPTSFDATSTASISTNTWTYVAAVKNGGTITLYINGSADGTASPTGTYRNASFGFGIGRPGDYNGVYFTGYIDEFRMAYVARTITASPTGPFPLG